MILARLQAWGLALLGLLVALLGAFGYGRYKGSQAVQQKVDNVVLQQKAQTADQVVVAAGKAKQVEQQVEGMTLDETRKTMLDRWARD